MKVVCIKRDAWKQLTGNCTHSIDPKFNEIVTIIELDVYEGETYYEFAEYLGVSYYAKCFVPLDYWNKEFNVKEEEFQHDQY